MPPYVPNVQGPVIDKPIKKLVPHVICVCNNEWFEEIKVTKYKSGHPVPVGSTGLSDEEVLTQVLYKCIRCGKLSFPTIEVTSYNKNVAEITKLVKAVNEYNEGLKNVQTK